MSDQHKLKPGEHKAFSTRPVGLKTSLSVKNDDQKQDGEMTWHIELCCKDNNIVKLGPAQPKQVDISSAAGALVTAINSGFVDITVWTDY